MSSIQICPLFRYHLNIFFLACWFFLYYSVQPSWCKFNFQAFVSKLCFCFWISLLFVISLSGIVSIFHLIGVMVQGRKENVKKQKVFSAEKEIPFSNEDLFFFYFVQYRHDLTGSLIWYLGHGVQSAGAVVCYLNGNWSPGYLVLLQVILHK